MLKKIINPIEEEKKSAAFEVTGENITKEKVHALLTSAFDEHEIEVNGDKVKCFVTVLKFIHCTFEEDAFDGIEDILNRSKVALFIFEGEDKKSHVSIPLLEKLTRSCLSLDDEVRFYEKNVESYPMRINNLLQDWRNKWALTVSDKHPQSVQDLVREYQAIFKQLLQFKMEFLLTLKEECHVLQMPNSQFTYKWGAHEKAGEIILKSMNQFSEKLSKQEASEAKGVEKTFSSLMKEMRMYILGERVKKEESLHSRWNYFTVLGKYTAWRHYLLSKLVHRTSLEIDTNNLHILVGDFYTNEPRILNAKENGLHLMQCVVRGLYMAHASFLKFKSGSDEDIVNRLFINSALIEYCNALKRLNFNNLPDAMIHDLGVSLVALFDERYEACMCKYDDDKEEQIQSVLKCLELLLKNNRDASASKLVVSLLAQAVRNAHQSGNIINKKLSKSSSKLHEQVLQKIIQFYTFLPSDIANNILSFKGCYTDQMWLVERFSEVRALSASFEVIAKEKDPRKMINKVFNQINGRFSPAKLVEYFQWISKLEIKIQAYDFDPYADIAFVTDELLKSHYYNIISTYVTLHDLLLPFISELKEKVKNPENYSELIACCRYLFEIGQVLTNNELLKVSLKDDYRLIVEEMHVKVEMAIAEYESILLQEQRKKEEAELTKEAERIEGLKKREEEENAKRLAAQKQTLESIKPNLPTPPKAKKKKSKPIKVKQVTKQVTKQVPIETQDDDGPASASDTSPALSRDSTESSDSANNGTSGDPSETKSEDQPLQINEQIQRELVSISPVLDPKSILLNKLNFNLHTLHGDVLQLCDIISYGLGGREASIVGDYTINEAIKCCYPDRNHLNVSRLQLIVTMFDPIYDLNVLMNTFPQFIMKEGEIYKLCGSYGRLNVEIALCHPAITPEKYASFSPFALGSLIMNRYGAIFDFTLRGISDLHENKLSLTHDFSYYEQNPTALFEFFRVASYFGLGVDQKTMADISHHKHYLKNCSAYVLRMQFCEHYLSGNAVVMSSYWIEAGLFDVMLPKIAKTWVGNEKQYQQYCLELDQSKDMTFTDLNLITEFLKIAYAPLLHSLNHTASEKSKLIWNELNDPIECMLLADLTSGQKGQIYAAITEVLSKKYEAVQASASSSTFFSQPGRTSGILPASGLPKVAVATQDLSAANNASLNPSKLN